MRALLLLNGEEPDIFPPADGMRVYCCDGAYEWGSRHYRIDCNTGDFDSLGYIPSPAPDTVYPSEKDMTDGEIATDRIIADGAGEIVILGGFGGRTDHFLGNIHLLYRCSLKGVRASMVCGACEMRVMSGEETIDCPAGTTVSVLPMGGDAHILGSRGLKYAYPEKLVYGSCRGISNVVTGSPAEIRLKDGDRALLIINRTDV